MPERTYGEIDGFPAGSTFIDRDELAESGVHRPPVGGICGGKDGAESIVLSGGYEDIDNGTEIFYTGQGGQNSSGSRHIADQKLTLGNAGLARSYVEGYPVRVVRGAGRSRRRRSQYAPESGLRYDGLFRVADFWHETGRDGFRIWRFHLVPHDMPDLIEVDPDETNHADSEGSGAAARKTTTIQRIVRNSARAQRVKEIHGHQCQICGYRIDTPTGPYAEAAHIRALGKPHHGPDVESNVLCLCPNHHVMFDTGAIYIDELWIVCDTATDQAICDLRRHPEHTIGRAYVDYHREHFVPPKNA